MPRLEVHSLPVRKTRRLSGLIRATPLQYNAFLRNPQNGVLDRVSEASCKDPAVDTTRLCYVLVSVAVT